MVASTVLADPLRSGKDWAIYALAAPADWRSLIQSGNLAAGKPVQAEPVPNDWNTGSDLGQLTDGVLAGAEGRMWSDKRAVGWAYQDYARLTFDLGKAGRWDRSSCACRSSTRTTPSPGPSPSR